MHFVRNTHDRQYTKYSFCKVFATCKGNACPIISQELCLPLLNISAWFRLELLTDNQARTSAYFSPFISADTAYT
ncbi:MAG: hypothetical protein L6406_06135, partial [Desulfobacterales bacterium]|nr:hypothetical protein [Desulfobacterales bacterium]